MSLSVLLVDDDPMRAAIVEPALREAGYEVVTVVDSATVRDSTGTTVTVTVQFCDPRIIHYRMSAP